MSPDRAQEHRLELALAKEALKRRLETAADAFAVVYLALTRFEQNCAGPCNLACRWCQAREALEMARNVMRKE